MIPIGFLGERISQRTDIASPGKFVGGVHASTMMQHDDHGSPSVGMMDQIDLHLFAAARQDGGGLLVSVWSLSAQLL